MDSDAPSSPAKEDMLAERTLVPMVFPDNAEQTGRLRAAIISHLVPTQTSVNKALDPRPRSPMPNEVEHGELGRNSYSTVEQSEHQSETPEPPSLTTTAITAGAPQEQPLSSALGILNAKSASTSGIVITNPGECLVPPTTRPNGSIGAMNKVSSGYKPPEDEARSKVPTRTEGGPQASNPFASHSVPEDSQNPESNPQTMSPRQNTNYTVHKPSAMEGEVPGKRGSSLTDDCQIVRRRRTRSLSEDGQASKTESKASASSLQLPKPEKPISRPATPPNRSSRNDNPRTPSAMGNDQTPGSNNTQGTLAISPENSPPRPIDLAQFSPELPRDSFSRMRKTKKASRTRTPRPLWYDGLYAIRQKDDAEYLRMEQKARLERFYVKGSKKYAVTSLPTHANKSRKEAIKEQWFRLIERTQSEHRPSSLPGFQKNFVKATPCADPKRSSNKSSQDDKSSPSSPLEPDQDNSVESANLAGSLGTMGQDTPRARSPDVAALPETPTPAGRAVGKRKYSPSKSPEARKSRKTKKPLKRTDTLSRLLEDARGEVEYIKGKGPIRVNDGMDSSSSDPHSEEEATSDSSAIYDLKLVLTDSIELRNNCVVQTDESPDLLCLQWIADKKLLFVSHNEIAVEGTKLSIELIQKVYHGSNPFQFHIQYGSGGLSGIANPPRDICLCLDCSSAQYTTLTGILSRHVGGLKVNRMSDPMYFDIKIRELRKLVAEGARIKDKTSLETSRVPPSKPMDSTVLDPSAVIETSTTATTSLSAASPAEVAIRPKASPKKNDRVAENMAESAPEQKAATPFESEPECDVAPSAITSIVGGPKQPESPPVKSNVRPRLRYRSGQVVAVGDLVVRLRDRGTIAKGRNKHDRNDIFDGPYPIMKVPKCVPTPQRKEFQPIDGKGQLPVNSRKKESHVEYDFYEFPRRTLREAGSGLISTHRKNVGNGEGTEIPSKAEKETMLQTLVKLKFPKRSTNPWTKLDRLVPVLESIQEVVSLQGGMVVDTEGDNNKATSLAEVPTIEPETITEHAAQKVLHLPTDSPIRTDHEPPTGMVRLRKGVQVAVQYVAPYSPASGSHYEVSKLRGKRLRRFRGKEAKGLQTDQDDPWVRRYIKSKGSPKQGEVLVAEYLVHWSGWPSECDTWERGEGNIPESFLRDYTEKTDPDRGIAEDDEDRSSDPEILLYAGDGQVSKKGGKRKISGGSSKGKRGRPRKSDETIVIDSSSSAAPNSNPRSSAKKKGAQTSGQAKFVDDEAGEGGEESGDEEARLKVTKRQKRKSA
ncbi:MAG: hypothetical protein M1835_005937 [Candelina submexicana]|nr:MAG: hypothetical protein M1835_005937 [Candelina submexicana]